MGYRGFMITKNGGRYISYGHHVDLGKKIEPAPPATQATPASMIEGSGLLPAHRPEVESQKEAEITAEDVMAEIAKLSLKPRKRAK